ncbi:MAG: NAD(P)-dependent oxidoreductase, partial [Methylocystaceae bacterium]|nr:NAD(P)-dependent oxidoreductase [Methylocystaceae bacterium]
MKIGFVGLGQMGAPIALNLIRAGHELKVWNRSNEKTTPLIAAGAQAAKDPQDCASQDIVFSILSDDQAVENIAFGPSGLLKNHHPTLHVTMSTISPALVDCMTAAHRSQGGDLVSAPVFGRPLAAQAAKLFIIAAGTEKSLDLCEPLFNIIGQRTIRVGAAPQAANLVKLCGNFMIMSAVESLAEAMTLA